MNGRPIVVDGTTPTWRDASRLARAYTTAVRSRDDELCGSLIREVIERCSADVEFLANLATAAAQLTNLMANNGAALAVRGELTDQDPGAVADHLLSTTFINIELRWPS